MPYHLFDDNKLFETSFDRGAIHEFVHVIGQNYRIYGQQSDFREFYASLDLYEMSENGNQLILEGPICIVAVGGSSQGRIILTFTEQNGHQYVSYSFELDD